MRGCEPIHRRQMTSAHHGEELRAFLPSIPSAVVSVWINKGKMTSERMIPHSMVGSESEEQGVVSVRLLWNYHSPLEENVYMSGFSK